MKKQIIVLGLMMILLVGCTASDKEIKADIASRARKDLNFAGLSYTVQNGVVNVAGCCPSEKAFAGVQQTLKAVQVIKSVNYHVEIAAVTLNYLTPIKMQADSILGNYPMAIAVADTAGITLKGSVDAKEKQKLLDAFAKSGLGAVRDSTTSTGK